MIKNIVLSEIKEHQNVVNMINEELIKSLQDVANEILLAFKSNKKVLICGNGGSAADAQHFATELSCRYKKNRKALSAVALTTDTSVLTAIGNDLGFENIFKRQVEALANEGDVIIGISTSGESKNILNALSQGKEKLCTTVAFCGNNISNLKEISDFILDIPSFNTPRIQELHILFIHIICQLIDDEY
ncbi:MAG: D-sedoheptulose 7-phosphate isomerase [Campylobacterota bacterium]